MACELGGGFWFGVRSTVRRRRWFGSFFHRPHSRRNRSRRRRRGPHRRRRSATHTGTSGRCDAVVRGMVRGLRAEEAELGCGCCRWGSLRWEERGGREAGHSARFGERVGEVRELRRISMRGEGKRKSCAYPAFQVLHFQTRFKPRPALRQLVLNVSDKDGRRIPRVSSISNHTSLDHTARTLVESCRGCWDCAVLGRAH